MTDREFPAGLDGWVADGAHHYPLRVQFEDTDAGGIVYHAIYLAYAERGRSAFLRRIGVYQEQAFAPDAPADAVMFVVRRLSVDYRRAAGLGAALKVTTRMLQLKGASMQLEQLVTNFDDGHILARLVVDIGCVSASQDGGKRPRRMPSAVVDRLRAAMPPDTATG